MGVVAAGRGPAAQTRERRWRPAAPVDVALTLSPHRRGGGDPAWRRTPDGAFWRTSRTPEGPGTLRVTGSRDGEILGQAWGPGAGWLLEMLPSMLGADDDVAGFAALLARLARSGDPRHVRAAAFVADLAGRAGGLRIGRSLRVFEALAPAVLEQKVVGREAWRAWRFLLRRYGEPAPGPAPDGMYVVPSPEVWRVVPSWDWHRAGAEAVRARTIVNAARHAAKLERTTGVLGAVDAPDPARTPDAAPGSAGTPDAAQVATGGRASAGVEGSAGVKNPAGVTGSAGAESSAGVEGSTGVKNSAGVESSAGAEGSAEADRLLRALPGIGVWTSAEVRQRAHGDPDAPSVGDFHLPGLVGYAFTGRKTDDDGMLELLEPFRGHRHRVIRLIELSGIRPPARGPRMAARDYRSF
ncbi:DNA-3-methyladenine glycosylase 2 family protein [Microbispora sp. H10670]|uniref:DNA-3-methyladenine glycosylase family protein n=1 Tax=Microbispora sp. H10670 TaxID=2729108 RepID=UPI0028737ED5|nr:DNA-3-methyladenine glycosylase 2 family protein [Microbispora sp. H10670]